MKIRNGKKRPCNKKHKWNYFYIEGHDVRFCVRCGWGQRWHPNFGGHEFWSYIGTSYTEAGAAKNVEGYGK